MLFARDPLYQRICSKAVPVGTGFLNFKVNLEFSSALTDIWSETQ